ncbi:MAG: eukaryotic-like serine/threonine-protein kinase [Actinomycetota bacterium]|jgi:serine/threonine protein kinase|nr:eukaryotic-like serine/threonine-protein kinase [Actinomycetota bacterium]
MADAQARPARHTETTLTKFSLGEHEPEPVPAVIADRYEMGRLIGRGATARVFRAYDRTERRQVAMKLFNSGAVATEERRRLIEIRILSGLKHPGLVALYDTGTQGGQAFLTMELVEGPNLADRLAAGPLGAVEVTALAIRLADALAYVHERGVTHRDLKPANVLLDPDHPLISDFGIAQAFDSTRVTATGMVVGTAAYMAPEQVLGEEVGPPSDVYALGLVLLECLTGVREYNGTMVESAIVRLHRSPRIPAGLPHRLEEVLRGMTALRPSERPTARAVHQALRNEDVTIILPVAVRSAAPKAARHRRRLLGAGIPALAAIVTAGAIALQQPDGAPSPSPVQPVAATPSSETPTGPAGPSQAQVPAAGQIAVESTAARAPAPPLPVTANDDKGKSAKPKQGNGKGKAGND